MDWIKGRVRQLPDLAPPTADDDAPPEEEWTRAEHRLHDAANLFAAAGRPLALVFDQVENFRSFGPDALRAFLNLIERIMAASPATQVVIAANAADWNLFLDDAGITEHSSLRDRLHAPHVLRGLTFAEARELRDLRTAPTETDQARARIPDEAIARQLMVGPTGDAAIFLSPRAFLRWCAHRWDQVPDSPQAPQAPDSHRSEPDFETEWEKACRTVERESFGFFPDWFRTFILEVLGGTARTINGYEFLDDPSGRTHFAEPSLNSNRWQAWTRRVREVGLDPGRITALRPSERLAEIERAAWHPVPRDTWRAAHPLRALLAEGATIREIDPEPMRLIAAASRFLDAATDFGTDRPTAAQWLREKLPATPLDFFLAKPGKINVPPTKPSGIGFQPITNPPRSAIPPSHPITATPRHIVQLNVTHLVYLLTNPAATLPARPHLPPRERGVLFHSLASRFVRHLLAAPSAQAAPPEQTDPPARLAAFLARDPLWQSFAPHDTAAPRVADALAALARHVATLGGAAADWRDLYLDTELDVHQTLGSFHGITILLSGRCDVLRRRSPGGPPEVVDYKLAATPDHAVENQLQLALYARLLADAPEPLRCDGVLEIYSPGLTEVRFPHESLLTFYNDQIVPVLDRLAREAATNHPSPTTIQLDTHDTHGTTEPTPPLPALTSAIPPAITAAFDGFVGNSAIVSRLQTALADSAHGHLPTNLLFTGPGGLGKSEIARRVARALALPLVEIPGSRVRSVDDLLALVDATLEAADQCATTDGTDSGLPLLRYPPVVIFIDEVHELRRRADAFLNLFEPRERRAVGKKVVGDFANATLLAATTDAGLLPRPFLSRFHPYALEPYSAEEVAAMLTDLGGTPTFRASLARVARLNPRLAKLRAAEFLQHHRVHGHPLDEHGLDAMRKIWRADADGLEPRDHAYLAALADGPRGVQALAGILQLTPDEITRDIEPHLVRLGKITTSRQGRRLA